MERKNLRLIIAVNEYFAGFDQTLLMEWRN